MKEYQRGDRVKVTIVGRVGPRSQRYLDVENDKGAYIGGADLEDEGVTVEKLPDPLPTTPGTVIRGKASGSLYMRTGDGGWVGEDGTITPWTLTPLHYEVIYDTGKAS